MEQELCELRGHLGWQGRDHEGSPMPYPERQRDRLWVTCESILDPWRTGLAPLFHFGGSRREAGNHPSCDLSVSIYREGHQVCK